MPEALILTHGDLDGLVCGLLLLRRLGDEAHVKITNELKLASHLREAAEKSPPPTDVFITDVPLEAEHAAAVTKALRSVRDRGARVHVCDHHSGWELPFGEPVRGLLDTYVVDTRPTTAAALVKKSFLASDAAAGRWLALLSRKEESPDESIREDFGVLVALMQAPHYVLTTEVLRSMSRGEAPDVARHRLSTWYVVDRPALEEALVDRAEVLVTGTGRRIGWLDARREQWRLFVTPQVMEMHGVELVATVSWKGVTLGAEGIERGPNLRHLHGTHECDGVALHVVGHGTPVLLKPANDRVTEAFLSAARSFLRERF